MFAHVGIFSYLCSTIVKGNTLLETTQFSFLHHMKQSIINYEAMSLEELANEFRKMEEELSSLNARAYALGRVINMKREEMRAPFDGLVHPDKGVMRYIYFLEDQSHALANVAHSAAATCSEVGAMVAYGGFNLSAAEKRAKQNAELVQCINALAHVV